MAITYVAERASYNTTLASFAHTVPLVNPAAIAVGNHLIARVSTPNAAQHVGSVTDPRGNSWQSDNHTGVAASTSLSVQTLSCRVETPYQAGDELVFNLAGSSTARIAVVIIDEFSGIRSTNWKGSASGWGDTSGAVTTFNSNAINTAGPCLQVGAIAWATASATTRTPHAEAGAPTAWTPLGTNLGAGGTVRAVGGDYRIVGGAESGIAYDGTLGTARTNGANIVEYRGSSPESVLVREWTHACDGTIVQVTHNINDLEVAGGGYELWLTMS
jgi:hypothetical protein